MIKDLEERVDEYSKKAMLALEKLKYNTEELEELTKKFNKKELLMAKVRADILLYETGGAESREKAKRLIMSGEVFYKDSES